MQRSWNDRFAIVSNPNEFVGKKLPEVPKYKSLNGGEVKPTFITRRKTISISQTNHNNHSRKPTTRYVVKNTGSRSRDGDTFHTTSLRLVKSDIKLPRINNKLLVPILSVDVNSSSESSMENYLEDSFSENNNQSTTGTKATNSLPNSASSFSPLLRLCVIGKGSSAAVYKSILLQDLSIVADKVIAGHSKDKRLQLTREIDSLRKMGVINGKCPYIVQFIDVIHNTHDATMSLCLEYMDLGSLQDIIDKGGVKNEFILRSIAIQMLNGLACLHKNSIIHRDLKPANVLLNSKGEVKISDFGLSKEVHEEASQQSFVGTYVYMSPERMSGHHYTFAADIWSCGLTIEAVAIGKYPYQIKNDYWAILQVNYRRKVLYFNEM